MREICAVPVSGRLLGDMQEPVQHCSHRTSLLVLRGCKLPADKIAGFSSNFVLEKRFIETLDAMLKQTPTDWPNGPIANEYSNPRRNESTVGEKAHRTFIGQGLFVWPVLLCRGRAMPWKFRQK